MISHDDLSNDELKRRIINHEIKWGGNRRLKIYGRLDCQSGKRMNRTNRVFFKSEQEAIALGYRPCGHCCRHHYYLWKSANP